MRILFGIWTRPLRSILLIAVAVAVVLVGCTESAQPPLRISSSPWPGYEPLYLARDLNYLPADRVQLFELPSSDINMESFRNRSTDISTLTLDETLELLHDGNNLRILLVMDISHGGDAVMVSPEIKTLADLKGKRISIVNITLGLYMLSRLLDAAGLERSDVEVFPMPESKQEQFYLQGKADVVITFEPVKTKLRERGMRVIFDSANIPNEIFDLLVVHEDVYLKRRDDLCFVVNQWFKALDYIKTNKPDAARRITKRLDLDVREFDNLLDGIILPTKNMNYKLLGSDAPGLLGPAKKLAKIMLNEQQLSKSVDASVAIDKQFATCYKQ